MRFVEHPFNVGTEFVVHQLGKEVHIHQRVAAIARGEIGAHIGVGEQIVEHIVGIVGRGLGDFLRIIVNQLPCLIVFIVSAIGKGEEACILHIPKRFGPGDAPVHRVGRAVIFVNLVDGFIGVGHQIILILCESGAIFVGTAIGVAQLGTVAPAGMGFKFVGKHQLTADVESLAIVVVGTHASVHEGLRRVAGACRGGVGFCTIAETEREIGAEFQRVAGVGLPKDAEIGAHIVDLGARSGGRTVVAGGVGEHIAARCRSHHIAVAVIVVYITAGAEFVGVFVAHIKVEAHTLTGGNAIVVAPAHKAGGAGIGKVLGVGIVAATKQRELVAIGKIIEHKIARIAIIGAIASGQIAKPAIVHAFLHGEVDDRFVFAIVHPGEACQIALAVDYLQFINHTGRNVFRRHFRVVAKKFLTINQNFLHFLAIGGNFAFAVHFHAGHSLQNVFHHGIGLSFVGVGIVFYGVFFYHDGCFHSHHHGLFQEDTFHLHRNHAKVHASAVLPHRHLARHIVVAQIGALEHIAAGSHAGEIK